MLTLRVANTMPMRSLVLNTESFLMLEGLYLPESMPILWPLALLPTSLAPVTFVLKNIFRKTYVVGNHRGQTCVKCVGNIILMLMGPPN